MPDPKAWQQKKNINKNNMQNEKKVPKSPVPDPIYGTRTPQLPPMPLHVRAVSFVSSYWDFDA
jgi:hypothetical protein